MYIIYVGPEVHEISEALDIAGVVLGLKVKSKANIDRKQGRVTVLGM